jgi:hypothetical protein
MHRITKVLYSGAIACSIVAGAVGSAGAVATGDDGCTPGYWKNHTENWQEFKPGQTLASAFAASGVTVDLGKYANTTLLQALRLKGGSGEDGSTQILLRATTAALLNAAYDAPEGEEFFGYPLRRGEILQRASTALAGDRQDQIDLAAELDDLNNSDCPLN